MDRQTKILLIAGVAGVGLWWWFSQGQAQASLAAHTPAVPVPAPIPTGTADQIAPPALTVSPSGGTVAMSVTQQQAVALGQMTTALLAWAQQTKNPALYATWINQLGPSDIASLYNILTTYWAGTAPATPAQISYWNSLVAEYPFLKTGGVGCSNLACS